VIEVLKPGPLALIEDAGRPGLAAVGVSPSGAFDRDALAEGARLVGNHRGAAAIEVTLGGLVVRSTGHHTVALTGAECPLDRNGEAIGWGVALEVSPADVLTLGLPASGLRSYLSVAGGFDVPAVLGSRSTDVLSGLGPPRLAAGDFLAIGTVADLVGGVGAAHVAVAERLHEAPATPHERPSDRTLLELLPGPRTDWLADPGAMAGSWMVSPDSNRIGVRLSGPPILRADAVIGVELPSEPLVRGAVQLPPSGQPVLFGPDHPTTGGYPVVAVLTGASSDRLAQCRPGDRVQLRWLDAD
jgi:biotin-dependent carboxylase-like uncharacterized protein